MRPEARRSPTTSRARFYGIRRKCFILPMVQIDGECVATAKPGTRRWLAAGIIIAGLGILATWLVWPQIRDPVGAYWYCDEGQCIPLPRDLKGIGLGMTPAEVDGLFPEDVRCAQRRVHTTGGRSCGVSTQLGVHPASCELEFAVEDRVSRIECRMRDVAIDDFEHHQGVEQEFLSALRNKYGLGSHTKDTEHEFFTTGEIVRYYQKWTWSDGETRLALSSSFTEFASHYSRLELTLVSREHEVRTEQVREQHRRDSQREAEKREEERRRRRQELKKTAHPLEDDL